MMSEILQHLEATIDPECAETLLDNVILDSFGRSQWGRGYSLGRQKH